ncbi:MAG: hypothetical protein ACE37J_11430 [Pikeienuella sp.]|uniref:hypothetical protein n=1 Tax=Pikeienuella sp. TaxID=2831957 RepID=UPI003919D802
MAHLKNGARGAYLSFALLASGPLVAALPGCTGTGPEIFDRLPPSGAAAADWPRLADTPPAPPQGVYTEAAPDPERGEAVQRDLAAALVDAERRRAAVSGPVR